MFDDVFFDLVFSTDLADYIHSLQMSMNDNKGNLPNQNKNVWMIDSEELTTGRLNPVNDNTSPGHWSITLKIDTNIDTLLDSINNADGWKKVSSLFCSLIKLPALLHYQHLNKGTVCFLLSTATAQLSSFLLNQFTAVTSRFALLSP